MTFTTTPCLIYGNLRDELSMLIMGRPPKDNEPEFRRILKEAISQLLNEAAASPDSLTALQYNDLDIGAVISLPPQYGSIIDAWAGNTSRKYTIIDARTFETLYPRSLDAATCQFQAQPLMIDLGLNQESGSREYKVVSGNGNLPPQGSLSPKITVQCRVSLRPIYQNIYDDASWPDTLRIYPDCQPAIKEMMLSIIYGETGNTNAQIDKYTLAVKYLNDYLRRYRQGTFTAPNFIHQGGLNIAPNPNIL